MAVSIIRSNAVAGPEDCAFDAQTDRNSFDPYAVEAPGARAKTHQTSQAKYTRGPSAEQTVRIFAGRKYQLNLGDILQSSGEGDQRIEVAFYDKSGELISIPQIFVLSNGSFGNASFQFTSDTTDVVRLRFTNLFEASEAPDEGKVVTEDKVETKAPTDALCFAPGTEILTPSGPVPIETLKKGDLVMTADNGPQPLTAVTAHHWTRGAGDAELQPIRIEQSALGLGLPEHDLMVPRQHRLMVSSKIAKRITGEREVLIEAHRFCVLDGVVEDDSCDSITWYHLVTADDQVIFANGVPAETLLPEPRTEAAETQSAGNNKHPCETERPARLIPDPQDQEAILSRHIKNGKELLAYGLAMQVQRSLSA